MNKFFKRMLTGVLAVSMLFTATACGGGDDDKKYDSTKSQLTVYSYNGGVGNVWLDKVIERFEEDFKDYEFEPGKKGVQIAPNKTKTGQNLATIQNMEDVVFSEYIDVNPLILGDNVIKIDDIVTTPLNEVLEGRTTDTQTIHEKLYPETQEFYAQRDGEYYGLPHYSTFSTLIYNKKLFDNYGLYFAKTPASGASTAQRHLYFVSATNTVKSCGPDGVEGTTDDGLPATWDEFFILCDYMSKNRGVVPFVWAGAGADYAKYLLNAIYLNLVGGEVAKYNYNFSSGTKEINTVSFDTYGTPTYGSAVIDQGNKVLLNSQLERYQTFEIFDRIVNTEGYTHEDIGKFDMLSAQEEYVYSYNENNPVAFLAEGSYWYNEATDGNIMYNAELAYGDEYKELNDYHVMPLPHVYNGKASDVLGRTDLPSNTICDQSDSFAGINAKIASDPNKVKLAKMFLAYCYTDESLKDFSKYTNTVRFMKYEVEENTFSTDYAKNLAKYMQTADKVFPYSTAQLYLGNKLNLSMHINAGFWEYGEKTPYQEIGAGVAGWEYFKAYSTSRYI